VTLYHEQYSEEESAFQEAFSTGGGSTCGTYCECGRCYFIAGSDHGDYEEGQLDDLLQSAQNDPDKFIPEDNYSSIEMVEIGGERLVVQCKCAKAQKYIKFFESHLHEIAKYAAIRLKQRVAQLRRELAEDTLKASALGESLKEYQQTEARIEDVEEFEE